jgi:hypothetical protein
MFILISAAAFSRMLSAPQHSLSSSGRTMLCSTILPEVRRVDLLIELAIGVEDIASTFGGSRSFSKKNLPCQCNAPLRNVLRTTSQGTIRACRSLRI